MALCQAEGHGTDLQTSTHQRDPKNPNIELCVVSSQSVSDCLALRCPTILVTSVVFGVRPSKDWPDLERPAASTDFKFLINFKVLSAIFLSHCRS